MSEHHTFRFASSAAGVEKCGEALRLVVAGLEGAVSPCGDDLGKFDYVEGLTGFWLFIGEEDDEFDPQIGETVLQFFE